DMSVTASDAPDPVAPDGNITYTVNVTNAGPDAAQNATMNVILNNTLRWQSMTVPAGWSCPSLSVGHGATFTCTAASLPVGTSVFTIVMKAGAAEFGISDQTISQTFTVTNSLSDPNGNNNTAVVQTAYVTPDADLSVTASDAPDPVVAGQNITYTIAMTNAGPDAAPNAHLQIPLTANVNFQSFTAPEGWICTTPAIGAGGTVDCTQASFGVFTANFTLVTQVNPALLNGPGGTIQQTFTTSSGAQDPNSTNNTIQVPTTFTTPIAELVATNVDTPDPVSPAGTITYTQTITNNGPNAATNAKMTQTLPAGVTFASLIAPAGFSCTTPAIGANGTITCNAATLANGANAIFTLTTKVAGNATGAIANGASVSSATFDPNNGNSSTSAPSVPVTTGPSADLSL